MNRLILTLALITTFALAGCGTAPAPAAPTPAIDTEATVQAANAAPVAVQPTKAKAPALTLTPRNTPAPTLTPVPSFTPTPEPTFDDFADVQKLPTPTPADAPLVTADQDVNLRSGPGTNYEVVGTLSPGQSFDIIGRNVDSSWWQIAVDNEPVWVAASVVKAANIDQNIEIAEAPPPPPPTATAIPTRAPTVAPTPTTVIVVAPPPVVAPGAPGAPPAGASAKCNDGSYSYSANRRGTCSHHGGVAIWY